MKLLPHSALVVCSDDRWENLNKLVGRILELTAIPAQIIFAVNDKPRQTTSDEAVKNRLGDIQVLFVEGGLPAKRKASLKALRPEIEFVHFIDDDFHPSPSYFDILEHELHASGVAGAGGTFAQKYHHPSFPVLRRLFLLDGKVPGSILPSGWTTNAQANAVYERPIEVECLSGCSMSFRLSVLDKITFPTELDGYAMDEDLILSFRASKYGRLRVLHTPGSTHLSEIESHRSPQFRNMAVSARKHFVKTEWKTSLKWIFWYWSLFGLKLGRLRKRNS